MEIIIINNAIVLLEKFLSPTLLTVLDNKETNEGSRLNEDNENEQPG